MSALRHPIDISEANGVRYLHFGDECVQGAMRVARPWSLELEYTREMLFPLLLHPTSSNPEPRWPQHCLVMGLGPGSQLKFLHRHFPHTHITGVEIDPRVVATAQQFFKLPAPGPQLQFVTADGAEWVKNQVDASFDLILLDGFDAHGRPGPLDTEVFYAHCRRLLRTDGQLACNLLSRSRGYQASVRRLHQAFAGHCLVLPPCDSGNAIAVASPSPLEIDLEMLQTQALALKSRTRLDLRPSLSRLQLASHR